MDEGSGFQAAAEAPGLAELRRRIDGLNEEILGLLQRRGDVVMEIARVKRENGLDGYDPAREEEMLHRVTRDLEGAFGPAEIKEVFHSIFRVSLDIQDEERRKRLRVRKQGGKPAEVRVGSVVIGNGAPVLFAGPCSVETPEQMDETARTLARFSCPLILRAGAFKPRTSPQAFQGLRERGLEILREAADRYGLLVVTEVLDASTLAVVAEHADMIQVGSRNMYNTELLKALGKIGKPVLLKRGFMATLEEFLLSAEYILSHGNPDVVLCERGIRTFEPWTRNTLDIAAIPLLKSETDLPVIVDVSHALGRKDVLAPCAKAALAAGADGIMIEAHPAPDLALSDGFQQIDLGELEKFVIEVGMMAAPVKLAGENGAVPRPAAAYRSGVDR
ncbi:MAG TPA: bifunctional 3-deoxy-7-phosphoheptulonate synthase/chorismate mutase [bacterium]|nr:bifunctional 3-deoxy-7-phosphoheptulonate synthase/chorismate mutase [bacterium]